MSDEKREKIERVAPILRTPEEWRLLLGTRMSHYACARVAHGWLEHEHHQGEPLRLSQRAYLEAVAGGLQMPPEPSPNAVSPHIGRGR